MEPNVEWRQLGAVVSGVMAQLDERRREQQRFIAESRAEVAARVASPSRPARNAMGLRQLELPLFIAAQPQRASLQGIV